MSIQIGKFLPEKDNKNYIDCSDYTQGRVYGRNEIITEASKVEIGLDREKTGKAIEKWFLSNGYKVVNAFDSPYIAREIEMSIADALIAAESELIVRKEGR